MIRLEDKAPLPWQGKEEKENLKKRKERREMKRSVRIWAIFTILALGGYLMMSSPSAQAQQRRFRWKIQTPYPLAVPYVERTAKMAERIKVMTAGRLDIKFYPPGGIVPAYSEWDAMQKGTLDGAFITPSDVRGIFGPVGDLFNQYPAGPTGPETVSWMLFGDGEKLLREVMDKVGFTNVVFVNPANLSIAEDEMWTNKKINTPADYKGLKIRTFGYWGKILEGVGASVVTLPGGELYQAMERGVIDACEYGTSADNYAIHLNEVAKYCYYPGVHSPGNVHYIFANKNSWEKLPADLREVLKRESLATAMDNYSAGTVDSAKARKAMKAKGTIFLPLSMEVQAFIVEKSDKLWKTFAQTDATYAKVYKNQTAFLKKYRDLMGQVQPDFLKIDECIKEHK
jgi:TRAP-type mannitol/chloroaromatic compound transport system substrate-binding protein